MKKNKTLKLNKDERDITESFERDEWKSVSRPGDSIKSYQEIVRANLAKNARINIRISLRILEGLQQRAVEEGIPYQTLIASVLHKFVSGRLVDEGYNKHALSDARDSSPSRRRR